DPEAPNAHVGFEARNLVERCVTLGERNTRLERQRRVVAPDATAREVREGRVGFGARFEQSATVGTPIDGFVERSEGSSALDTGEPDAVCGTVGNGRSEREVGHRATEGVQRAKTG